MSDDPTEKTRALAAALIERCRAAKLTVATAESCTGGLAAAAITEIPGASDIFDCSFVTYSNSSKSLALSVSDATLRYFGAVSNEVAAEMALGALKKSGADLSVSVTGIAGPGGGSAEKPVGLVCFASARRGRENVTSVERRFGPLSRAEIRAKAVVQALEMLLDEAARPRP